MVKKPILPIYEQVDSELFTDREKILSKLWKWVTSIPLPAGYSQALLSQRRMGKTSVLERLYNRLFLEQDRVMPIYYRVTDWDKLLQDFVVDYYINFVKQYVAFRLKDPLLVRAPNKMETLIKCLSHADQLKGDYILEDVEGFLKSLETATRPADFHSLWGIHVSTASMRVAEWHERPMVVILDEFQEMDSTVYWDQDSKKQGVPIGGLTRAFYYHCTSRAAPMLVAGSAVTILSAKVLGKGFPGRFGYWKLGPMSDEDGATLSLKWAARQGVETTFEMCLAISRMVGGNPEYIKCIFTSDILPSRILDLETVERLIEFEVTQGKIWAFWDRHFAENMERINDSDAARRIVLYIAKRAGEAITAREVERDLDIDYQPALDRLRLLTKADIISGDIPGWDSFQGLQDKMLYKYITLTLRGPVERVDQEQVRLDVRRDLAREIEAISADLETMRGTWSQVIGRSAEIFVENVMYKFDGRTVRGALFNAEEEVRLPDFTEVYRTRTQMPGERGYQIDVFGRAEEDGEDIGWAVEVRKREPKFGLPDVAKFRGALESVQREKRLDRVVGWVFSTGGFTGEAAQELKAAGVLYSTTAELQYLLDEFHLRGG